MDLCFLGFSGAPRCWRLPRRVLPREGAGCGSAFFFPYGAFFPHRGRSGLRLEGFPAPLTPSSTLRISIGRRRQSWGNSGDLLPRGLTVSELPFLLPRPTSSARLPHNTP